MKLIIDIPEEVLNSIKTFKGQFICKNGYDLIQGIKNGTPLEDVKKEIHKKSVWIHGFNYVAPYKFDEILDNIGKESEDKE